MIMSAVLQKKTDSKAARFDSLYIVRRIYIRTVLEYLEVAVRAGASSGASYRSNRLTFVNLLAGTYMDCAAVCIQC